MSKPIVIEGMAQLQRAVVMTAAKARAAAEKAVAEEVAEVGDDARSTAPEKTGALRAGIKQRAGGLEGEVEATARHSTFVEHGTFKDTAQPYMGPAAERSRKRFPARAGALIKAAVETRFK